MPKVKPSGLMLRSAQFEITFIQLAADNSWRKLEYGLDDRFA